jgi:predicted Zn-ribbon and HTH transcriptional regulator
MNPTGRTIRQEMIDLLSAGEMTDRDLSQALGIPERDVYAHLAHIARTLSAQGKKLRIAPLECLSCGFVFRERKRWSRPGRCPRCRDSHMPRPSYRIVDT